jgi:hypothetical protein
MKSGGLASFFVCLPMWAEMDSDDDPGDCRVYGNINAT